MIVLCIVKTSGYKSGLISRHRHREIQRIKEISKSSRMANEKDRGESLQEKYIFLKGSGGK